MYPTAIAVAFEMSVYGLTIGLLYGFSEKKSIVTIYISMLIAMILGRIVRCLAEIVLLGLQGNAFVWKTFVTGVILSSMPGIILQLILIPLIMITLKKVKLLENC